jgi:hypothetical protein
MDVMKTSDIWAQVARIHAVRIAADHVRWRRCKGRDSEACRGEKVRPPEDATVQWDLMEVCGVGVPLPESNLAAARKSKITATRLM